MIVFIRNKRMFFPNILMFHFELLISVATEPARFPGGVPTKFIHWLYEPSWVGTILYKLYLSIVRTLYELKCPLYELLYEHCMNKIEQMQDRVLLWFGLPTLITKPIGVVFTQNLKMYIWLFLLPLEKMTSISTCLLFYDRQQENKNDCLSAVAVAAVPCVNVDKMVSQDSLLYSCSQHDVERLCWACM